MTTISFKKLNTLAKIPTRATKGDAGLDLCSIEETTILPGDRKGVKTGLAVAIPYGSRGQIHERSGLAINKGIQVGGGVIDCGYRGELIVILFNMGKEPFHVKVGDKIAQLVIDVVNLGTPIEVEILDETERGTSGFGSSDRGVFGIISKGPNDLALEESSKKSSNLQDKLSASEGVPYQHWTLPEKELIEEFRKHHAEQMLIEELRTRQPKNQYEQMLKMVDAGLIKRTKSIEDWNEKMMNMPTLPTQLLNMTEEELAEDKYYEEWRKNSVPISCGKPQTVNNVTVSSYDEAEAWAQERLTEKPKSGAGNWGKVVYSDAEFVKMNNELPGLTQEEIDEIGKKRGPQPPRRKSNENIKIRGQEVVEFYDEKGDAMFTGKDLGKIDVKWGTLIRPTNKDDEVLRPTVEIRDTDFEYLTKGKMTNEQLAQEVEEINFKYALNDAVAKERAKMWEEVHKADEEDAKREAEAYAKMKKEKSDVLPHVDKEELDNCLTAIGFRKV